MLNRIENDIVIYFSHKNDFFSTFYQVCPCCQKYIVLILKLNIINHDLPYSLLPINHYV